MKVGIIGCGFIGATLAKTIETMPEIDNVYLFDNSIDHSEDLAASLSKATAISDIKKFIKNVDLVIESASQQAVKQYAPQVLEKGKDLLIMSVGALVDEKLWKTLQDLAHRHRCRIYLPSGAICGLDGIKSATVANIDEVMLVTTKPTKGLKDVRYISKQGIDLLALKKPLTVFEGTAKDAVKYFPKNVNVAASVSLAGIGFKSTKVKIIADPSATRNMHRIIVKGRFGEFECEIRNIPSMTNPKTSYLAALSAIATLKKIVSGVWIGT
jgi:aspartate dehydrogenase